mgnify:CR=1 FL=1
MKIIQKLFPSYLGVFNKLGGHMTTRLFRATFMDMFSQNTIVVEFDAPFPVDSEVDYGKLATQRLGEMIRKGEVAIRDVEPIEQQ